MNKLLSFSLDVIVVALAFFFAIQITPGVEVIANSFWTYIGIGVIFILVNATLGKVIRLVGLPITCLTLGLFSLVLNALVFMLVGWASRAVGIGLSVDGFWSAFVAAIIVSIASSLINLVVSPLRR